MPYRYDQPVLFRHCDPAGIVFYPRYFEMLNDTTEMWFDTRLGRPWARFHGPERMGVPAVAVEVEFTAPSRHGDVLTFTLTLARLGRTSAKLVIVATCGEEVRLSARLTIVCVSTETLRPIAWPDDLRAKLQQEEVADA
jgi:4-hydroxybenzoyl-CoA thioesterase